MLKLSELKKALETTGLPVAYGHYDDEQGFPYIVYAEKYTNNFFADGKVYEVISTLQVDLYTKTKNQKLERKVVNALDSLDVTWDKDEGEVKEENCYAVTYEFDATIEDEDDQTDMTN